MLGRRLLMLAPVPVAFAARAQSGLWPEWLSDYAGAMRFYGSIPLEDIYPPPAHPHVDLDDRTPFAVYLSIRSEGGDSSVWLRIDGGPMQTSEQGETLRFGLMANGALSIIDHHHSSIGQIADSLALVFAFTNDAQRKHFARQQNHTHGFSYVMQVDVIDRLELRYFSQIVIVGIEFRAQVPRQPNQFGIHFFFLWEIPVVKLHLVLGVFLYPIEHLQSAPATRSFDGVRGIRDLLELFEHKARKHNQPLDEIRFDQVRNAPVDNHAGIEQQEIVGLVLRSEANIGYNERKIFFVAAHRQNDADVTEAKKKAETNEPARGLVHLFKQARAIDQQGDHCSQKQTKGGGGESSQRKAFKHFVYRYHQPAKSEPDNHADESAEMAADILGTDLADGIAADRA